MKSYYIKVRSDLILRTYVIFPRCCRGGSPPFLRYVTCSFEALRWVRVKEGGNPESTTLLWVSSGPVPFSTSYFCKLFIIINNSGQVHVPQHDSWILFRYFEWKILFLSPLFIHEFLTLCHYLRYFCYCTVLYYLSKLSMSHPNVQTLSPFWRIVVR